MDSLGTAIEQQVFLRQQRWKYSNYIFQVVQKLGAAYGFQLFNSNPLQSKDKKTAYDDPQETSSSGLR
jgi:hypothetical protein